MKLPGKKPEYLNKRRPIRIGDAMMFARKYEEFTRYDLQLGLGLAKTTAGDVLREMHRPERKFVYICAWKLDSVGRPTIPVYTWGDKEDVMRRAPLDRKLRQIAYEERKERRQQLVLQQAIQNMYGV